MTTVSPARAARMTPAGLFFLMVASVGWGIGFPIMKNLLAEWPPLTARGLAGMIGALALALIAFVRGENLIVPRGMWLRLFVVSTLTIGGWVGFLGLAFLWLKASEAAVLAITVPIWTVLLAWPILGERFSLVRVVALAAALAGISVLIGGNGLDASIGKLPGVAFALAAAISGGLGTVLTKQRPLELSPVSLSAWLVGLGCLPIAIVGFAVEQPLAALSNVGWASMIYLTLVQFCVCYVCWFAALARLPAATASIGLLLIPVVGVASATAMLHESLGIQQIAALTFTLGGVALAMRS
jgi:probable blue pigment (indigoidine) exporter